MARLVTAAAVCTYLLESPCVFTACRVAASVSLLLLLLVLSVNVCCCTDYTTMELYTTHTLYIYKLCRFTDEQVWSALESVQMKQYVSALPGGISAPIRYLSFLQI
jgi:hypothetical protein